MLAIVFAKKVYERSLQFKKSWTNISSIWLKLCDMCVQQKLKIAKTHRANDELLDTTMHPEEAHNRIQIVKL